MGSRKSAESSGTGIAAAIGAVAGAAILVWGVGSALFPSSTSDSEETKTMKAPGRDARMPRESFERDAKGYFRDLHEEERGRKV
ncbi:hypothetical protein OIU76_013685 [Salix suchowensis]|uniref:Uncharacterized protein n=1 Tax=Salix suchowensis TaxID=1278906 RepID=A0ABQ9A3L8_9ROSI|nr:hypothetical protein OIU76_013685 [Salix suchowensis]KAJ6322179.1 hypothetical protein OIU77_012116 [Salix suchowensis]